MSSASARLKAFALLWAIPFLGSCESSGSPSVATVTDSAGVEIVLNAAGDLPEMVLVEELRIGAVEGDEPYLLSGIRDVVPLGDGRLLVVNSGSGTVRIFGPDGSFIREFAGRGGGPGEAGALWSAGVAGDTVHVMGTGSGPVRALLFNVTGEFLTSWPLGHDRESVSLLGRAGRYWLGSVRRFARVREGMSGSVIDSIRVHRIDPNDGSIDDHVMTRPGRRLNVYGGGEMGAGPIFDPLPQIAPSANGVIYYTLGGEYDVEVYDGEGTLFRRIRRPTERTPVTPAMVERYKRGIEEFYRTIPDYPTKEAEIRAVRDGREPDAEFLPIVGRILAGQDGELWIERRDLQGDPVAQELNSSVRAETEPQPQTWEIVDQEGRVAAFVRLPPKFEPHAVGEGYVVGVLRDELDVEYVVRYGLEPREVSVR